MIMITALFITFGAGMVVGAALTWLGRQAAMR